MENIDINFAQLNRDQVLQRYTTALWRLRQLAEENYRVRPLLFDNYVIFQYFQQRPDRNSSTRREKLPRHPDASHHVVGGETGYTAPLVAYLKLEVLNHILDRRRQILYWLFYLLLLSLCVYTYRHEATRALVKTGTERENAHSSYVYPGMRMWRRMTLPLIERFPRLTELYDESCLMGNPFFQVEDLSCAPCAHAEGVVDISEDDIPNITRETSNSADVGSTKYQRQATNDYVPFVFKSNQDPIKLEDFYDIYASNDKIFQRDAYRVHSTNQDIHNLEDLFGQFNSSNSINGERQQQHQQAHNLWRCNRMLPARLLRPIFARPEQLPSMGVALERYIAIDTPQAPAYTLPETECANVYLHQAVGSRFIVLRPTSECRHRCRTLSMHLPQSFVLSYNWLYWKPVSAPNPISDTLSISLIGSYC